MVTVGEAIADAPPHLRAQVVDAMSAAAAHTTALILSPTNYDMPLDAWIERLKQTRYRLPDKSDDLSRLDAVLIPLCRVKRRMDFDDAPPPHAPATVGALELFVKICR